MDFKKLIDTAIKTGTKLDRVIADWYMLESGASSEEPFVFSKKMIEEMFGAYEVRLKSSAPSLTGWVGDTAEKLRKHSPVFMNEQLIFGLEVALSIAEHNASMGKIVACPTAGSCGVVPGVILSLKKFNHFSVDELSRALVVAGAVGECIKEKASISGAVAGCQVEIGTATAMASTIIVYVIDNTNYDALYSAPALSLKALMGLVCDPVGGFVEIPCVKRNAFGVSIAYTAAEMALAGIKSIIPFDEVAEAMGKVGRSLPEELRETGKGGIAATPTAKKLFEEFINRGDMG
ncbi:L-serine ammonia-lyase, iron-sulfur-dependent, subunit beta [Kosmotoga pacifica]|uniref:L-serine ammonia-lyase n=1 Tax=Kosmotoga pacifica TaxID=1330330 RepID=A0A0G2ZDE4_9BACT|nr:L-serine ammonia-lyase, iron-sulfur-dependent, subunit alpha [Kosmotoga pacifica]AKI96833.1 serine deaminase [Kosmotoga pacifica]